MKKIIFSLLLVGGFAAQATAYTYCKDGTLYQCGGGDACNPEPCYAAGNCDKDHLQQAESNGEKVDLQPDVQKIQQAFVIHPNMCL